MSTNKYKLRQKLRKHESYKIAENLLKSGRSIKFTRSISFTQGEHHQLSIKTKNKLHH